ncbi:glycosyltransferase [uncultured Amnibacterium sp.]|uniref:glycosyltransferase family 2 protein n=1 Tax=uncultured Amnibacterium sp. TaxID=1631851 RepID=UPI0035CB404B
MPMYEGSDLLSSSAAPAVRRIDHLVVAIPARDEAPNLPAALAAIETARAALAAWDPHPPRVVVVVAADSCTDTTAELAREAGATVVETFVGKVGAARSAAVATGLAAAGAPSACWIACTDADSVVHVDWLRVHLAAARGGADLLLGSVRPSPVDLTPHQLARWHRLNPQAEAHPYVHGANLGVRADSYLQVGGFADVGEHEDAALVEALRTAGAVVVTTDRAPVTTSGRTHGRTPGGFAAYLRTAVLRDTPER